MAYLSQPGFLERLSQHEMERLGEICPPRKFQQGEVLYREGDACDGLTILLEGQVKLSRLGPKGERILYVAGPGDFIGTNFLDQNAYHRTDAVCLSQVTICPVKRAQIQIVARELPNVPLTLYQVLAQRLEQAQDQLELASAPVAVRLSQALLILAERFGRKEDAGWVGFGLELRQEDLAALSGTTRVTVTHTLGQFREQGLLEGTRGVYRVQLEKLRDYLEAARWEQDA